MSCDVGVYGLSVMGQNMSLNIASKGFHVAVSNRSAEIELLANTMKRVKIENEVLASNAAATSSISNVKNLQIQGFEDCESFVLSLCKPRKILILVQAGKAVDDTIQNLIPYMEAGDIIVDGGNEWYPNSVRRCIDLKKAANIHYLGMGVSGGEEGARYGPSLMVGGNEAAFNAIEPIFSKCAAQLDGDESCLALIGPIGAGNYVKMVHNGIEYADMQLIAEIYNILKNAAELSNEELSALFAQWNKTELESYLIEITSVIFSKKDEITADADKYVVDMILDKTGMKGTGRWTVQDAAERNVAIPIIASALDTRYISARKDERVATSSILSGPIEVPHVEKTQIVEDCRNALFAAKICSYSQGFSLIQAASEQEGWNIDLSSCARIWQKGCIIRASLLGRIHAILKKNGKKNGTLTSLMADEEFADDLVHRQQSLRRIVTLAVASGIAVPALSAAIAYYDQVRCSRLPANLTQAQRDFFGGHAYERVDTEGAFHTKWTFSHSDIGGKVGDRFKGQL